MPTLAAASIRFSIRRSASAPQSIKVAESLQLRGPAIVGCGGLRQRQSCFGPRRSLAENGLGRCLHRRSRRYRHHSLFARRHSAIFALFRGATTRRKPRCVRSTAIATEWFSAKADACSYWSEPKHARRRSRDPYAELAAVGMTSDAYHLVTPSPDPTQAIAAIRQGLAAAEVNPEDVDYVNAHATGTPVGDAIEAKMLQAVFGEHCPRIPVSSTKSMTGHLLSAAAAVEATACLTAMKSGAIPPTMNLDHPDPECDLCHVAKVPREARVRVAISNSFGFGGHNTSLVSQGGRVDCRQGRSSRFSVSPAAALKRCNCRNMCRPFRASKWSLAACPPSIGPTNANALAAAYHRLDADGHALAGAIASRRFAARHVFRRRHSRHDRPKHGCRRQAIFGIPCCSVLRAITTSSRRWRFGWSRCCFACWAIISGSKSFIR